MMKKEDWCPTRAGNFSGYMAQQQDGERWLDIHTTCGHSGGIPYPILNGGILQTLGLMSHAQAQAVRYLFEANAEADHGQLLTPRTRIVRYEVQYDAKARLIEDPTEPHLPVEGREHG